MRVFLTGATGFIGSAIANELKSAGHQVLGLARSDAAVATLTSRGIEAHRGDLTDVESLVAGARACDGVIHTAFVHDFSNLAASVKTDRTAIEAMLGALEGSGKPFVAASGTALLSPGQLATEDLPPSSGGAVHGRAETEAVVTGAGNRGVRASVVRLPPTVHGAGDHGFVPMLIGVAREKGLAAYVGDGENRWPAVHRLDAAHLLCLAFEKGVAGSRYHAIAEGGVPMRSIAETIGAALEVPVRGLTGDEVAQQFGWMAMFVGLDNPASSAITREALGWQPDGPELLADMREHYFAEAAATAN